MTTQNTMKSYVVLLSNNKLIGKKMLNIVFIGEKHCANNTFLQKLGVMDYTAMHSIWTYSGFYL